MHLLHAQSAHLHGDGRYGRAWHKQHTSWDCQQAENRQSRRLLGRDKAQEKVPSGRLSVCVVCCAAVVGALVDLVLLGACEY